GGTVLLGGGTLTIGTDNSSTSFAGAISGSGTLTKAGTGTLTLTGANSFGVLNVNAGSATFGAGNSTLTNTTSSFNVSGGTLTVSGGATLTAIAATGNCLIDGAAGAKAVVPGAGSQFNTRNVEVGFSGSGNLTVQNGGALSS